MVAILDFEYPIYKCYKNKSTRDNDMVLIVLFLPIGKQIFQFLSSYFFIAQNVNFAKFHENDGYYCNPTYMTVNVIANMNLSLHSALFQGYTLQISS